MQNATCQRQWARLVAVNESVTYATVCPQPVTDGYLIMDEQSACAAVADTEPGPQFTAVAAECGVDWEAVTAYECRHSTVTECVLSCYKRSISISLAVLYIELMAEYGELKNEGISQHLLREKQAQSAKYKICKTEPSPAPLKTCTNIYAEFIACPYSNAAGVLCTNLRWSLGDTILHSLPLLQSYYQVHSTR